MSTYSVKHTGGVSTIDDVYGFDLNYGNLLFVNDRGFIYAGFAAGSWHSFEKVADIQDAPTPAPIEFNVDDIVRVVRPTTAMYDDIEFDGGEVGVLDVLEIGGEGYHYVLFPASGGNVGIRIEDLELAPKHLKDDEGDIWELRDDCLYHFEHLKFTKAEIVYEYGPVTEL